MSDYHHLIEINYIPNINPRPPPPSKFSIPLPLNAIWEILDKGPRFLKCVCLFQVKFNFSIENVFFQGSVMTE